MHVASDFFEQSQIRTFIQLLLLVYYNRITYYFNNSIVFVKFFFEHLFISHMNRKMREISNVDHSFSVYW